MSQILGFMSRRGHGTGTICTYSHTWLLKTDKKGLVQITPAIRHDQKGTSTKVSVTEVRQANKTPELELLCICSRLATRSRRV